jgi:hypothetical protein
MRFERKIKPNTATTGKALFAAEQHHDQCDGAGRFYDAQSASNAIAGA